MDRCRSCGRKIDECERAYVVDGELVCTDCEQKLPEPEVRPKKPRRENDTNEIREAWGREIDPALLKAATEDWDEYSPSIQAVIEAEAKRRGLWEKVLYLKGEKAELPISSDGNLEGYVCEGCKGTYVNLDTGRCGKCDFPVEDFGYCKTCDKFFSIPARRLCPEDDTKLVRHKVATHLLRFENDIFDIIILRILVFPVFILVGVALSLFIDPNSFVEMSPLIEFILGVSYVFIYYFVFESIWQRTPAKFITGTKVIDIDGRKPTIGTIAKRTLIRFVPFEAFSFLGERVWGWHDKWSGTYVIKAKRFERKKFEIKRPMVGQESLKREAIINKDWAESVSTVSKGDTLSSTEVLLKRELNKGQDSGIQTVGQTEATSENSEAEKPPTGTESQSIMLGRLEKCANCERVIGKLEYSYGFKGRIVCIQCYQKLEKQM